MLFDNFQKWPTNFGARTPHEYRVLRTQTYGWNKHTLYLCRPLLGARGQSYSFFLPPGAIAMYVIAPPFNKMKYRALTSDKSII